MEAIKQAPCYTSYSAKRIVSARAISSFLSGLSRVAKAKHRSVSRPVPYSLITDMIFSLIPWVMGTRLPRTRTYEHLSITPSGAPYKNTVSITVQFISMCQSKLISLASGRILSFITNFINSTILKPHYKHHYNLTSHPVRFAWITNFNIPILMHEGFTKISMARY